MTFLPINRIELEKLKIHTPDFCCVTGDAYIDSHHFPAIAIARNLERLGFSVAMIEQPTAIKTTDFKKFGKPKYGFFVTSGLFDSMYSIYSAPKVKREFDPLLSKNKQGSRPDYALASYSKLIKLAYPDSPVILFGQEATGRRFAHYDYISNKIMPSILSESNADLLIFGDTPHIQAAEIAMKLRNGSKISQIIDIENTCYTASATEIPMGILNLPPFEQLGDKKIFTKATLQLINEQNKPILQKHPDSKIIISNSPAINSDNIILPELTFMNAPHPAYNEKGNTPLAARENLADISRFIHKNIITIDKIQDAPLDPLRKQIFEASTFVVAAPGITLKDAVKTAVILKKYHIRPKHVRDFFPTPGSIESLIYYTEYDPIKKENVFVCKNKIEREMQRALIKYYDHKLEPIIRSALLKTGRRDLISQFTQTPKTSPDSENKRFTQGNNAKKYTGNFEKKSNDGNKLEKKFHKLNDGSPSKRKTTSERSKSTEKSGTPYHSIKRKK